jgi:DNA-directed RNA polymerase beta subunit
VADSNPYYRAISATEAEVKVGPVSKLEAEKLGAHLRRALMRQVTGSAVSAVRIAGASHEFALVDGVVEDALQIVENLRGVHIALRNGDSLEIPITLKGPATMRAADLAARQPDVHVANPDLVIATLIEGCQLDMSVEVTTGTGFDSASNRSGERPNWISIDCSYGPVTEVSMDVEGRGEASVLVLGVHTNGGVGPAAAVVEAASRIESEWGPDLVAALGRAVRDAPATPDSGQTAGVTEPPQEHRDLGKTDAALPIPDLLDLPRSSFEAFVQAEVSPEDRVEGGLEKLLRRAFPLDLKGGDQWNYTGYTLTTPELDPGGCHRLARTYAAPVVIHLQHAATGATALVEASPIPLMTERGTFIIGGRERVVVARLQAPPGGGRNDLAQRQVHPVGSQLEAALSAPMIADVEAARELTSAAEVCLPRLAAAMAGFFEGGGTVRPVEGTNPLAVLSQARGIVQQGVGRPDFEARDAHMSHFGRLCALETPEGERIGINLSAALFASVDEAGRMKTPYLVRDTGAVEYLSPAEETEALIADAVVGGDYQQRYGGKVLSRLDDDIVRTTDSATRYSPVHPAQTLGASSCLIPFLAHDDANRALMATNMQKQAVPLLATEAPLTQTGLETTVAADSGAHVRAVADGTVVMVTADAISVREAGPARERTYPLTGYSGSAIGTCWRQRAIVCAGEVITAGQTIGTGPSWDSGALALGRNLLVGYMSWEGSNFEDSLVISDRLLKEGLFTSVKVREFTATIAVASTETDGFGHGHLDAAQAAHLSSDGLALQGARLAGGDVLIGRASTAHGETADASVRLAPGQHGTVTKVEHYAAARGDALEAGVAELARVTVAVRRRLQVGDKLANRHGGKGIVGRVVPEDEMPVMPDGRSLDLLASPLGVPSRMNIGQLLETHLGLAARALNCTMVTPGFGGALPEDVRALLAEAGLPESGMLRLRDGRTGRLFEQETTVGYHYYMKLIHMAHDKLRARASGSDALPGPRGTGGDHRGMRVGIMETWALQAHGAGRTLQEMQTLKADDRLARRHTYEALLSGAGLPRPTVPESVRRLILQLRGLCLDLRFQGADGEELGLLDEGASVDEVASISLRFAGADVVRGWSAGQVPEDVPATGASLEVEDTVIRHLELAAPVPHPWRELVGVADGGVVEDVVALPVLPPSLRSGRRIDGQYLAVYEANEAVKKSTSSPAEIAALQAAVAELLGDHGLTHQLLGKRGWFAAAMSGKAVDYSGRAVVAPGYALDYDQCGLPRAIARTLFEPLVLGDLMRAGHAANAAAALELLEGDDPRGAAALERVAEQKLVLLHRAPVLHRLGIQAFQPVLTDEEVIRIHPLALGPFNADFDGDELDVFLPLSDQAQEEAATMLPSANQMGPATGRYISGPAQDMVLGWYYATVPEAQGSPTREFGSLAAVAGAYENGEVHTHDTITITIDDGAPRHTTVGRALLNEILPTPLRWVEAPADKARLTEFLEQCWRELGPDEAARLADAIVRRGHQLVTRSGLSIGLDTLPQYSGRHELLADAWAAADHMIAVAGEGSEARTEAADGAIDHWVEVISDFADLALRELAADRDGLNPVHLMMASGARGNRHQIKQHIAMRGLLATPDQRIIEVPCTASFGGGLSPLEHLASTFGARKGLADTCLKTANAGFLFKRVMSAVQDVRITEEDCGVDGGVPKLSVSKGPRGPLAAGLRVRGRTAAEDVVLPGTQTPVVQRGALIDKDHADAIAASGLDSVAVRSPLTCRAEHGICSRCYGVDMTTWQLARPGLAAGVLAAHSIGEPLTQLTLRTFYVGALSRRRHGPREPTNIVAGLPRLDELLEAGCSPVSAASDERQVLEEMLRSEGTLATAEYLLGEIDSVYRLQGVVIDERHLEVVLAQMLGETATGEPAVLGVSETARQTRDIVAVATAYGSIPALARLAAGGEQVALDGVRSCTTFGKVIPRGR